MSLSESNIQKKSLFNNLMSYTVMKVFFRVCEKPMGSKSEKKNMLRVWIENDYYNKSTAGRSR